MATISRRKKRRFLQKAAKIGKWRGVETHGGNTPKSDSKKISAGRHPNAKEQSIRE